MGTWHTRRTSSLRLQSKAIGNNTLTIRTFLFSPQMSQPPPACTASFCDFFFCRPTGRPRHTLLTLDATGVPSQINQSDSFRFKRAAFFQSLKIKVGLAAAKTEVLRINLNFRGLWHSSSPSAHTLLRSPSSPPHSFTQSPFPPRSLVRDGQTSPHSPRLVVSHSTCLPLSPSPHANSFIIGTAVINTHSLRLSLPEVFTTYEATRHTFPAFWRRGDPPVLFSIYLWVARCSQAGFSQFFKGSG